MKRPPDLKQLVALMYVHDFGGYTEAAKQLNLTQPAVSWQLKELSRKLGKELVAFLGGKQYELTDEGLRIVALTRAILALTDMIYSNRPDNPAPDELQRAFCDAQSANARMFDLIKKQGIANA